MELIGSRTFDKTLLIQANKEISVVAVSSKQHSTGATTVLPVEKLGTEYYVVTPVDTNNDKVKEFAVVAGKQGAAVDITVKGDVYYQGATHPSGSTVHVNLAPYESLQLQSTKSLSGTKVTSNEAVAVLSGHSCVQVNSYCDYAIEQLLPVSGWGNEYIVPPVPMQTESDLVYVVAPRRTTITYRLGSSQASENVMAGDVQEFKLQHNTPFYVTAPAGIQVIYFFTGIRKDVSGQDPFLVNIPPVSSYCTSYSISSLDDFESHILLVAQHSDTSAIKFNKKLIGNIPWRMIPGLDYSWAMYSMSKSTEVDSIEHSRSPFGVLVFGFQNYEGYGFAGLCATPTSPPSCADLECKEHETCTVVKGNPTCVKDTESICWATGDPHYRTFDGKNFDFMGTCTYTLSKTCTSDASLPVFSVEAKNENRGNTQVSYVGSVTVRVYDIVITVVRGETGIVRVNNQRSRLPISLADGKLKAYQNGDSVLIKTDFLLKVFFDWDHHLVVKIPSKLSNKVCGLCGNSNGDPRDDATTPDGLLASDPVELGRSWKVDDGDRFCWDDCNGECKTCSPKQIIKYKADTSCGLLTKKSGPFQRCHATIDPKVYLDNCVYDLCMNDGLQSVLCQVLKTYADKCREAEIAISDWRTPSQCPMSCPENSVYTACGPACPATCNDLVTSTECQSLACVETCACREGFVLDAGKCIPKAECGCAYEGRLFAPGEEFWADDACTRHCVCDATSRQAKCRDAGCRIGEQCRVEKGILDCYPVSYGTCSAAGRTHYQTFDGSRFVFQGSCLYQLAGLCKKSQGLVDFQVLIQNGHQDNQHLSAIAFVQVKVYGGDIAISQKHPGKIMVDNLLVNLPYRTRGGKVSAYQGGRQAVVETDFGLTVTYDWQSQVTVSVPGSYAGALCGLCGNFDGNAGNELLLKDGQATSNPTTFGHSWKVKDIPGCVELPQDKCPTLAEALQYQDTLRKGCRIISSPDGPFRACHRKVDPEPYFQSCVSDFCFFQDQPDVTCPLIASYAAACQAAGVATARWRTADFCSISCPANSHYESCSRGCGQTCSSLYAPAQCSERCWEGCVCNEGFVLSGDRCVPMSQCGCLHQGLYYQLEETFLPTCWQQCQCQAGGAVQCQNSSCVVESDCKIVDGVRKCEASGTALCVVTGDRQYISYDGLAFEVPGACSYVLTKTCGDDGDLTPFVVTVEKEPEKTTKGSVIKALTVRVYGLTLTLLHGKMETVMVDNITYNLPAILRDGQVSVLRHGADVLLLTDFGLTLRYDLQHAATVAAPATYRGRLCGLCGNRDGRQANDWLLPDGRPAATAAVFGAAWQEQPTQPCADACGDGGCPSCPAEREAVLRRDDHCGLLVAAGGPLAACHAALDPAPFFHTCLHDGCLATADGALLCRSVHSYAAACADIGVAVRPWREPAFCPPSCPANSTYSLCADLCAGGCASLGARCPEGCAEGCRCAEGLLFDGRRCVPAERCGCFQDGRYYQPGEETLTESCHRRCTCVASQGLRCDAHACPDDETCEIRDGAWSCVKPDPCKALGCRPKETCVLLAGRLRCVPSSVAECSAWGEPHFRTFDGKEFDFHGTCTYTLASSCDPDPSLTPFSVEARNEAGASAGRAASYISLHIYGLHVVVRRGEVGKIRVNGVLENLPVSLADGKLRTALKGQAALLRATFGLEVHYDWDQHLVLKLPSTYYKATCGLCGNFDEQPGDDGPPAGADNAAVAAWASEWRVKNQDDSDDC
ncbi:IgGFc-binding protein-like [Apteryx mantelli]|uniref:IgGFc-binding protein-like n=1 Tax=Apteryx mantelli TaxID=2696672 RepID=A0ABM4G6T9_9AVES